MEQEVEKTDKVAAPILAVDGARVRSVREAKKLTQLYVASVVGVTTDTISRWENNRYPSIKRENAEKLAAALEVELEEILRKEEEPEGPATTAPVPAAPRFRVALAAGLAASVIVAVLLYLFAHRGASTPTATRWLPQYAAPGEVVPVQIKVIRKQGDISGFILKEKVPDGVRVLRTVPPSSAASSPASEVKWLIPAGSASVTVSYTMRIPSTAAQRTELRISGRIVARSGGENRSQGISGSDSVRIGPFHWADGNGDGRIDDEEIMPAYYVCEAMKDMGLDWKTIEEIWGSKGYRWDPRQGYTVVR